MSIIDARDDLADVTNHAAYGKERIVVTSHGRVRAVLVPPRDLAILEERVDPEEVYPALRRDVRASGERMAWAHLKRELGI